jgi:hypothetical protein
MSLADHKFFSLIQKATTKGRRGANVKYKLRLETGNPKRPYYYIYDQATLNAYKKLIASGKHGVPINQLIPLINEEVEKSNKIKSAVKRSKESTGFLDQNRKVKDKSKKEKIKDAVPKSRIRDNTGGVADDVQGVSESDGVFRQPRQSDGTGLSDDRSGLQVEGGNPTREGSGNGGSNPVLLGDTGVRLSDDDLKKYLKGTVAQAKINKRILDLLDTRSPEAGPNAFSDEEKELLRNYEGLGTGKDKAWAFYTPRVLIDKLWSIVEKYISLDKNSNILEPSAGTGRFQEIRPEYNLEQVELNPLTARINQILNPDSTVKTGSFLDYFVDEDGKLKDNYDGPLKRVVIGNPPYGTFSGKGTLLQKSYGSRYEEYFVNRGLDTLEEGGLVAYVMPSGWLNGAKNKVKEQIAKKGVLLDAYRLPENIFKGTAIGTDIVIIRKDSNGSDVNDFCQGNYFQNNKEKVLGTEAKRKNRFGKEETYVTGSLDDLDKIELNKIQALGPIEVSFNTLVNSYLGKIKTKAKREKLGEILTEISKGNFFAIKEQVESGKYKSNLVREAIDFALSYSDKVIGGQDGLNRLKKDCFNAEDNKPVKTPKKKGGKKTGLLGNQNAVGPHEVKAKYTLEDFNKQYGRFTNAEDLATWKNVQVDGSLPPQTVYTPSSHGRYKDKIYPNILYYSGNIYDKLEDLENQLQAKLITESDYSNKKAKLLEVLPKRKTLKQIVFNPQMQESKDFFVIGGRSIFEIAKSEMYDMPQNRFSPSNRTDVFEFINNVSFRKDKGEDSRLGDSRRDSRRQVALKLFNEALQNALNDEEKKELEDLYNKRSNSYVAPDYSKIPIFTEGLAKTFKGKPLKIKDIQLNGIAFLGQKGSGMLGYEVGVGKTMTAIIATVQSMQRGWCKKPVIVVPKAVSSNWVKEIKELYPDIKVNDLGNLGKESGVPDGWQPKEGEINIITKEGMKNIGYSDDDLKKIMGRLKGTFAKPKKGGKGKKKGESERDITNDILHEEDLKDKANEGARFLFSDLGFDHVTTDEAHNYKNLIGGVSEETKQGNNNEFSRLQGATSDQAFKLFCLTSSIQANNNNRGVYLATATPFENQPMEIYSQLNYLCPHRLQEIGVNSAQDFLNMFVELKSELVITTGNEVKNKDVVKTYRNLSTLQNIIREYIDFKTADEAGIERPKKNTRQVKLKKNTPMRIISSIISNRLATAKKDEKGIYLEAITQERMNTLSPALLSESQNINLRSELIQTLRGMNGEQSKEIPTELPVEPYFRMLFPKDEFPEIKTPSNKMFDPWKELTGMNVVDASPKLKFVVDQVGQLYKKMPHKGQVIFVPRGVERFKEIKDRLIDQGLNSDSIAIIDSGTSEEKKQQIMASFNDPNGKVKVVIGSETIKEGVNLQGNTVALYNTFLNWNPTQTIQVEGRSWRQGNVNDETAIIYPLMYDSSDVPLYQKHEEKMARLDALWSYKGDDYSISEIDPQELKYDLIDNPSVLGKLLQEKESSDLHAQKIEISATLEMVEKTTKEIMEYQQLVRNNYEPNLEKDEAELKSVSALASEKEKEFKSKFKKDEPPSDYDSRQEYYILNREVENLKYREERIKSKVKEYKHEINRLNLKRTNLTKRISELGYSTDDIDNYLSTDDGKRENSKLNDYIRSEREKVTAIDKSLQEINSQGNHFVQMAMGILAKRRENEPSNSQMAKTEADFILKMSERNDKAIAEREKQKKKEEEKVQKGSPFSRVLNSIYKWVA